MKVAVLGAGNFGLAISKLLISNKNEVSIWGLTDEICANARGQLQNSQISTDLNEVITGANVVFIAVGAQNMRKMCEANKEILLKENHVFITLAKGIEIATGSLMTDVIKDVLKIDSQKVLAAAGPNLASDIMLDDQVGMTFSFETKPFVSKIFETANPLIDFATTDAIELVGSAKNVYAILCGYNSEKGALASSKATLLTQISNELETLIAALLKSRNYSNSDALATAAVRSFAGFGDLILTCTSANSRNFTLGTLLAKGLSRSEALNKICSTVEGEATAEVIVKLAENLKVEAPILQKVCKILSAN